LPYHAALFKFKNVQNEPRAKTNLELKPNGTKRESYTYDR